MYDCKALVCLESLLTLDVFIGVDARAIGEVFTERTRPVVSACFCAHACFQLQTSIYRHENKLFSPSKMLSQSTHSRIKFLAVKIFCLQIIYVFMIQTVMQFQIYFLRKMAISAKVKSSVIALDPSFKHQVSALTKISLSSPP